MKTAGFYRFLLLLLAINMTNTANILAHTGQINNDKIIICHIPPGNPENQHTIEISVSAWPAHLAHGDTMGPCDNDVNKCLPESITGGSIAFTGSYNPSGSNIISSSELPSSLFASLGFEYVWLKSTVNTPNVVGNTSWSLVTGSENLTELSVSGLTQTMYYIRCARVVGCDMYWGETNTVEVAVDPCKASYINGGSIAFTGPYNPSGSNIITNSVLPSSPFASLGFEYVWLQSEVNTPNVVGNSNWSVVTGSENLTELSVSGLTQTMYYIRCARVVGCDMYWGETNTVEVAVDPCKAGYISGGSIAFTGPYNPSGSNIITNSVLPSSPFASLGFEYVWLQSEVNTPNVVGNSNWSVVTGSENLTELSVSGLTQTMYYIRCARVVGCDMYWGETNTVEVAVDPCKAGYISGGSIAFTGPYNPSGSNIITNSVLPSSPFASLGFEYVWLQSEVNTPNVVGNSNWSVVTGSENLTELSVSGLTQTMYYIRCARVVGCDMYWGETNIVEVAVDPCKAGYISGGSIAFTGPYNPSGSNIITNSVLPSSPFASLGFEYVWLQSEVNTPNVVGNSNWSVVTGSENLTELSVSGLTQTMYYIRCARVVGCDMYWGETNIVEVAVDPCKAGYISGGSIAFTGPYNPSGSNIITNSVLPSSPFASLGFEYVWLQSEVNTPNVVGNSNWSVVTGSENLTELSVSGLTQTMYYIRCARVVGCDMYWGETNTVEVAVDPCKAGYISGGSIAFTGPYNPSGSNIITNSQLPSSPFASLGFEYVWLQSEVNTPNVVGNSNWSVVTGSENLTELSVSGLTQTMYYIRCARVVGCDMYWGETNTVEVAVDPCKASYINGGSIAFTGPYNPSGSNIITNSVLPSSPFASLGFEYVWLQSEVNTPNVVGNSNWSVVTGSENLTELSVSGLTQTMYYIRCARVVGCDMYWGETNTVEVAVDPCKAGYISGGSIAFTGPYNPSGSNIITNSVLPSSPFASLGFEYVWLQSEVNTPNVVGNSNWSVVTGSENLTELSVSGLTQTMYYIRCARVVGCDMYWGETNIVEVAVDPCKAGYISGGSIAFTGPYNPSGSNIITNSVLPSSPFASLGFEYVWLQSEVNTPNVVGNSNWSVVTGSENLTELSVSGLTQTMYYIRCARVVGCDMYWGETNTVEVEVFDIPTATLSGGGQICGSSTSPINIVLTGAAPFDLTYTNGTENTTIVVNENNYSFEASVGHYSLISVSDIHYQGTVSGETNVTSSEIPTATLSGNQIVCGQGTAPLEISLTGAGPFNLTYSNGIEYIEVVVDGNTYAFDAPAGTYSLVSVSDASCQGTVEGQAIVSPAELPTATLSGNQIVCGQGTAPLEISLTGAGPFNLTYSNGIENIEVVVDGNTYAFDAPVGTYSLVSVSDASCQGTVEGQAIVSPAELPTATLSGNQIVCGQGTAPLEMSFTGAGPFNLTYSNGIENIEVVVDGNTYAFDAPVGTYSLVSVSDASCQGTVEGQAIVSPAELPTATLSGNQIVCGQGTAPLEISLTGAGPFNLTYSNGIENIEVVVDGNTYAFDAPVGTYSLVSVSDASCQGTVEGQAIVSPAELPTATLSGNQIVCGQGTAPLEISLTGAGPFNLTYSNGIENIEVVVDGNTYAFDAPVGTYSLVSVSDASCQGTVEGQATVSPAVQPTATLSGNSEICAGELGTFNISLTGTGPWGVQYTDGSNTTSLNLIENVNTIEAMSGSYTLLNVSDVNCTGFVQGSAIITTSPSPTASISIGEVVCENESATISISLTGTGPWNIVYTDGVNNKQVTTKSTVYSFGATSGTFELVSVSDQLCSGTVSGIATVTNVEKPTATISGGGIICGQEQVPIQIDLTGQAPWTFIYQVGQNQESVTTSDPIYIFNTVLVGNYVLATVTDANCKGIVNGLATITENSAPVGQIYLDTENCIGNEIVLNNDIEEVGNDFTWTTTGSGNLINATSKLASYVAVEEESNVQFTLSVFNGCTNYEFSASTNFIGVSAAFTINPEPTDGNLISNVDYTLSATDLNATAYSWDFGDGNGSSNSTELYAYSNVGNYQISLTATNGECTDTQSKNVAVIDNQNLFVPNVFSPNSSNSENNVLKVYGEDLSPDGFEFYVYNRWGQPVYHTSNLTKALSEGWNGLTNNNEEETNVFTYTLRGKFNNGKSFEKTGTVTLVK